MRVRLLPLLALVMLPAMARAEPGETLMYRNDAGDCGFLWTGDEYVDLHVTDPSFSVVRDALDDAARCGRILDRARSIPAAATELDRRDAGDGTPPCRALAMAAFGPGGRNGPGVQAIRGAACEELGLRFLAELPHVAEETAFAKRAKSDGNQWWWWWWLVPILALVAGTVSWIGRARSRRT